MKKGGWYTNLNSGGFSRYSMTSFGVSMNLSKCRASMCKNSNNFGGGVVGYK